MTARLLGLAVCGLLLPLTAGADDTKDRQVLKNIDVKDLKLTQVRAAFTKPIEITSAEELAKAFPDKEVQERLKKEVNFGTHRLLYFAWSGSGQDRLDPAIDGSKPEVLFVFTPGRTRDYRAHFHLFALRKNVPFKLNR